MLTRHVVATLVLCLGCSAGAQVTNTATDSGDAFLCTGAPANPELGGADLSGLNFGAAGTLVVAPASSPKGEFQSMVRFDLSPGADLFNSTYGSNHWMVTGISLQLTSNYGTAGVQPNNGIFPEVSSGSFVIEWLSDNDWEEGTGTPNLPTTDGVCYDSLRALTSSPEEILSTNTYSPPGNNVPVIYPLPLSTNLLGVIQSGGVVTFRLYAADNQIGYLFNSSNFGGANQPVLNTVAAPLLKILSATFANRQFCLAGVGGTNATYEIQASASLAPGSWQAIGTATTDDNGAFQFCDSIATNLPQRFYRLSE